MSGATVLDHVHQASGYACVTVSIRLAVRPARGFPRRQDPVLKTIALVTISLHRQLGVSDMVLISEKTLTNRKAISDSIERENFLKA